jgi:nicotinate-nucleotide pyrophosphorylase (carboxylating)
MVAPLHRLLYADVVTRALQEDLGRAGDLTSDTVVPAAAQARAAFVARQPGCLAGLDLAAETCRQVDARLTFEARRQDGDDVAAGEVLAVVAGPARGILTAERVALNFLGHLSGVATVTRTMVRSLPADANTRLACTRKTLPGLRAVQKYAVRVGGGANHRFGLDDAVMIKDNHRQLAGGIGEAVRRARAAVGHTVKIEVEVDTLEQLTEALEARADIVLLDNMDPATLRQAVAQVRAAGTGTLTEASGGITPETAAEIAATGVDLLSVGWLTHSAPNLDIGLDIDLGSGS